jgi:hypothetical protein
LAASSWHSASHQEQIDNNLTPLQQRGFKASGMLRYPLLVKKLLLMQLNSYPKAALEDFGIILAQDKAVARVQKRFIYQLTAYAG